MIDFGNVLAAVIAKAAAEPALADVHGKISFGPPPQDTPKPFLRITQVDDSYRGLYGHGSLESYYLQFSFFTNQVEDANRLVAALHTSFHGQPLDLTGHVSTLKRSGMRVADVGAEAGGPLRIYHASTVLEVRVSD